MGLFNIQRSNMLERRVTYKRRASYRTKGNKFRNIKTPGGKLSIQYLKKHTRGTRMAGVKVARPHDFKRMRGTARTVARPYGGVLTHAAVKDRITRAFMIEEINSIKQKAAAPEKKKGKKKGVKEATTAAKK